MLKEILTSDLQIGMYVYKLDRPWTETPFVFQGFNIKTQEDIAALQQHCFFVYIDTVKDTRAKKRIQTNRLASPGRHRDLPKKSYTYHTKTELRKEIHTAKISYENMAYDFKEVYKQLRDQKKLKVRGLRKSVKSMMRSVLRNPDAFLLMSKLKLTDHYYFNHSLNTTILAVAFGRFMGMTDKEIMSLGMGALLCDVGIVALPKEILRKKGQMNGDEYELFKSHVEHSLEALKKTRGITDDILEIVHCHHERYNGQGYPNGLVALQIPLLARMVSIADYFQELTNPPNSEYALTSMEAINILNESRDKEFQRELVDSFVQSVGIYATGSIVELSSGEVGFVVSQHPIKRLKPKVMLVLDKDKQVMERHPVVNLDIVNYEAQGDYLKIVKTHKPNEFGLDFGKLIGF